MIFLFWKHAYVKKLIDKSTNNIAECYDPTRITTIPAARVPTRECSVRVEGI